MKNFFIVMVSFFATMSAARAQTAKKPSVQKAPKLGISWGGYLTGDVKAEQFKKIVETDIMVKDEHGSLYPLTRFRINYIFISTYKDSESQQVKTVRDLRVSDFYDTAKLSETWRASISDNAKKGDTVLINNVIVRMKNGKKTLAPDFKFALQ